MKQASFQYVSLYMSIRTPPRNHCIRLGSQLSVVAWRDACEGGRTSHTVVMDEQGSSVSKHEMQRVFRLPVALMQDSSVRRDLQCIHSLCQFYLRACLHKSVPPAKTVCIHGRRLRARAGEHTHALTLAPSRCS